MKINGTGSEPIRLESNTAGKAAPTERSASPAGGVAVSGVAAQFSAIEAQFAGGADFDQAKVEALKEAIREGRFQVNAEVVADKLIASAQELAAKKSA